MYWLKLNFFGLDLVQETISVVKLYPAPEVLDTTRDVGNQLEQ